MFISQYIQRFEIKREVPVWDGSADGLVGSLGKYLCSHGIPKWKAVFRYGARSTHTCTTGSKRTGSPKQLEEPVCGFRYGSPLSGGEIASVGRPLGDKDGLDAPVLLGGGFLAGFSDPCGNAGGVHALFTEELLDQFGTLGSQGRRARFLGIGITHYHHLGVGLVLQAKRNVVEHAFASIVDARDAGRCVAAVSDFGGLRRWRWLLHVYGRGAFDLVAARVGHITFYCYGARLRASGIELRLRTIAGDLTA